LDLEELKNEIANSTIRDTEEKLKDYGMRIYTGSESMLRELKMSTPKEVKNS
jgi:hypothetical protein